MRWLQSIVLASWVLACLGQVTLAGQAVAKPAQGGATIRLVAVGDIAPGEPQGGLVQADVARVLGPAAARILEADLAFANLEAPLPPAGVPPRPGPLPILRGRPSLPAALVLAGFDVLSLANNHPFDFGPEGVSGTLAAVRAAGIPTTGLGLDKAAAEAPVVLERNGLRVVFLAATDRVNHPAPPGSAVAWLDIGRLEAQVRSWRPRADVVVVSVHWGKSYSLDVLPVQRRIAGRLVAAGADVVLGHHPHVLQPVERLDGAIVAYSLGNFLFGGQVGDRGRTIVLEVEIAAPAAGRRAQVQAVRAVPLVVGRDRTLGVPIANEDLQAFDRFFARSPGLAR